MHFYRYYTVPPEQTDCHVSAEIVSQISKEFEIEGVVEQERMMLDTFEEQSAKKQATDPLLIESSGPVISAMEVELQKEAVSQFIYLFATHCFLQIKDSSQCSFL